MSAPKISHRYAPLLTSIWINPEKTHMGPSLTHTQSHSVLVRYFSENSYIWMSRRELILRAPASSSDRLIYVHSLSPLLLHQYSHISTSALPFSNPILTFPRVPPPVSCQQLNREPDALRRWSSSPRRSNCVQIARLCANLRLFPVVAAATGATWGPPQVWTSSGAEQIIRYSSAVTHRAWLIFKTWHMGERNSPIVGFLPPPSSEAQLAHSAAKGSYLNLYLSCGLIIIMTVSRQIETWLLNPRTWEWASAPLMFFWGREHARVQRD